MYRFVTQLPRPWKWGIMTSVDVLLVPAALILAFVLQTDSLLDAPPAFLNGPFVLFLMGLAGLLTIVTNSYRVQLKSYETRAMALTALQTVLLSGLAFALDRIADYGTSANVFITFAMVYFLSAVSARIVMLQLLLILYRQNQSQCRVLIYGAGNTGRQLVAALRTDEQIRPVGFIDDNPQKIGSSIHGVPILGTRKDVRRFVQEYRIEEILISLPSADPVSLTQITEAGTVYSPAEVGAICEVAGQHGMPVHMDGARFGNAVAALRPGGAS